jgi:hypothetical protein
MLGDLSDFVSRLRTVLPKRWFAEQSPNLDALLTSIATPWVWFYGLITYVITQTRLATATDGWLDLIALDYFGRNLIRRTSETDFAYRSRIQAAMLQEAATRSAVEAGLQGLVGTQPAIFEPANCMDTGSYGAVTTSSDTLDTGMAYGQAGGWGTPNGGYCEGVISYVDLSLLPGTVADADVQATLCRLLPVNAVAWLRII